jgi:hypothetical protein
MAVLLLFQAERGPGSGRIFTEILNETATISAFKRQFLATLASSSQRRDAARPEEDA